jgi:hypothetical protein
VVSAKPVAVIQVHVRALLPQLLPLLLLARSWGSNRAKVPVSIFAKFDSKIPCRGKGTRTSGRHSGHFAFGKQLPRAPYAALRADVATESTPSKTPCSLKYIAFTVVNVFSLEKHLSPTKDVGFYNCNLPGNRRYPSLTPDMCLQTFVYFLLNIEIVATFFTV